MARQSAARPRPDTRKRILSTCQALFNERGPGDVTTAEIAAAVGINEGNLYYYFKRKEQILEALFTAFEDALRAAASAASLDSKDPDRYAGYLSGWFNLMWEWRFFYRDSALVHRLSPSLRPRVLELTRFGQGEIRLVVERQIREGLLRATPEQVERLIVNGWIVATYWIDYLRSRHGVSEITRAEIDWGALQVMSLFQPYLTSTGAAVLRIVAGGEAKPE
jgi:AcrR family transcriptional regulator